jgi:hypothetical protein
MKLFAKVRKRRLISVRLDSPELSIERKSSWHSVRLSTFWHGKESLISAARVTAAGTEVTMGGLTKRFRRAHYGERLLGQFWSRVALRSPILPNSTLCLPYSARRAK